MELTEHLDTQLIAWLERRAAARGPERADLTATALITVGARFVPEIERFAARWDLRVRRSESDAAAVVLVVDGRRLPVVGFAEIAALGLRVPAPAEPAPAPAFRRRLGESAALVAALSVTAAFAVANAVGNRWR